MITKKIEKPYPNIGEIIRAISISLDTKKKNRKLDEFARNGDTDFKLRHQMIEASIIDPLKDMCDGDFVQYLQNDIDRFLDEYLEIVKRVPLDGLYRSSSLPLIAELFLGPFFKSFCNSLTTSFFPPSLRRRYDVSEQFTTDMVFNWAEKNVESWSAFYKVLGKTEQDKIRKWRQGRDVARFDSLKKIVFKHKQHHILREKDLNSLVIGLLLSRAIEYSQKGQLGMRVVSTSSPLPVNYDIGKALSFEHHKRVVCFEQLAQEALALEIKLGKREKKPTGAKEQFRQEIKNVRELQAEVDPEGATSYFIDLLEGRWYIFSGENSKALSFYKDAFEKSLYSAGAMQEKIMKEALVLAAKCRDRSFMKRLKNQMISFGFLPIPLDKGNDFSEINNAKSRGKGSIVEDWEVESWCREFFVVFPGEYFFSKPQNDQKSMSGGPGLMIDAIDDMKPDFRNPDRKVSLGFGVKKKAPQLNWFIQFRKLEYTRQLLAKDASVNKLSESGESPLLMAIEALRKDYPSGHSDERYFQLVTEKKHRSDILNWQTAKKRLTPLTSAIYTGRAHIVKKLLDMGAKVDGRGQTDDQTALNICVNLIAQLQDTKGGRQNLDLNDPALLETIRRYNPHQGGLTLSDIKYGVEETLKNPDNQMIYDVVREVDNEQFHNNFTYLDLLAIVEVLLEGGADPNAVHTHPIPGYTPLMLATESNQKEVVELMLQHGGDPKVSYLFRNQFSINCWQIAREFGATETLALLGPQPVI